jgi:transcriptional regulator EpsA
MASSQPKFDPAAIVRIMCNSLSIQSHFQLLQWLEEDFQEAIRHDVLVCFNSVIDGDASVDDRLSAMFGMRGVQPLPACMRQFCAGAYQHWLAGSGRVMSVNMSSMGKNYDELAMRRAELHPLKHVLFHAIPAPQFSTDHLYILLRRNGRFTEQEGKLFELLLPHVAAAVRKHDGLLVDAPAAMAAPALFDALSKSGLSGREIEILEWVRGGKTNIEIGMILDISSYTVKNHLQRIFRKINVSNRAQAVGKLEDIVQSGLGQSARKLAPAASRNGQAQVHFMTQ